MHEVVLTPSLQWSQPACVRSVTICWTIVVGMLLPWGNVIRATEPSPSVFAYSRTSVDGMTKLLWDEFDLLYADRYFYIDNRGLTRVLVELNGYYFKLATDPLEVQHGANTYLIPLQGTTTLDIFPLLNPERNRMRVEGHGPLGADAFIMVADQAFGGRIDYVVNNLQKIPSNVALRQNYPNPFNLSTTIAFEISQRYAAGVTVRLDIFNLLGQKVRTLLDGRYFAGTFTAPWDGADDRGNIAAAGVYLYRLVVGPTTQTKRLVLLK